MYHGFKLIEAGQRTRARQVFARAHQFRDLPDVSQIVQRPFVQHLRQGDRAHLLVDRRALAGARRQVAQGFDVGLALLLEMVEGILGIHVAVQLQVELRVVAVRIRDSPRSGSGPGAPGSSGLRYG